MANLRRRRARENPGAGTWIAIGLGVTALGVGVYFLTKKNVGSASDTNSAAYACNTAWKLTALGHPDRAAPWAAKCAAGGGTVPADASQQYA